jgi:hypothetical protein
VRPIGDTLPPANGVITRVYEAHRDNPGTRCCPWSGEQVEGWRVKRVIYSPVSASGNPPAGAARL